MKAQDVTLNEVYTVKVSGKLAPVKITQKLAQGWMGINTKTGREIRIRTAAKLRGVFGAVAGRLAKFNPRCYSCPACLAVIEMKVMVLAEPPDKRDLLAWRKFCNEHPCANPKVQEEVG